MDVHAASRTLAVISEKGRKLRDFPVRDQWPGARRGHLDDSRTRALGDGGRAPECLVVRNAEPSRGRALLVGDVVRRQARIKSLYRSRGTSKNLRRKGEVRLALRPYGKEIQAGFRQSPIRGILLSSAEAWRKTTALGEGGRDRQDALPQLFLGHGAHHWQCIHPTPMRRSEGGMDDHPVESGWALRCSAGR